jgi:hypothetical protein
VVAPDGCGGAAAVKAGTTRSVTTTPGQACARLSTTSCPSSCPPPHAATTVMSCSWSRCRTAPRGTVRGHRRPPPESPLLQSTRRLVGQPATRADRADASPGHTGARPEPGRPPTRRRDRGEGSAGLSERPGRPARCGCSALHGGSGTGEHDAGPAGDDPKPSSRVQGQACRGTAGLPRCGSATCRRPDCRCARVRVAWTPASREPRTVHLIASLERREGGARPAAAAVRSAGVRSAGVPARPARPAPR